MASLQSFSLNLKLLLLLDISVYIPITSTNHMLYYPHLFHLLRNEVEVNIINLIRIIIRVLVYEEWKRVGLFFLLELY